MCHVFSVCVCVCVCVGFVFRDLVWFVFLLSPSLWVLAEASAVFHFRLLQTILPSSWFVGAGLPSGKELHWISWGKPGHPPANPFILSPFCSCPHFFFFFCCQALPDNNAAAILMWPRFAAFILQDWADLWPHLPVASTLGPRPQTFLQIFLVRRRCFLEVVVPPVTSANVTWN